MLEDSTAPTVLHYLLSSAPLVTGAPPDPLTGIPGTVVEDITARGGAARQYLVALKVPLMQFLGLLMVRVLWHSRGDACPFSNFPFS